MTILPKVSVPERANFNNSTTSSGVVASPTRGEAQRFKALENVRLSIPDVRKLPVWDRPILALPTLVRYSDSFDPTVMGRGVSASSLLNRHGRDKPSRQQRQHDGNVLHRS